MKEQNVMYKKCDNCGQEVKYLHEEGFDSVWPIDPQVHMAISVTVIVRDKDKDLPSGPYPTPLKITKRYLTVCKLDCFKKMVNEMKEEDFD